MNIIQTCGNISAGWQGLIESVYKQVVIHWWRRNLALKQMAKNDGDWSLYRPLLSLKANSCNALHFICINYVVKAHIKRGMDSTRTVPRSRISRDCQETSLSSHTLFAVRKHFQSFGLFSLTHLDSADACFFSQLLYGFLQKHQAVVCAVIWHVYWQKGESFQQCQIESDFWDNRLNGAPVVCEASLQSPVAFLSLRKKNN